MASAAARRREAGGADGDDCFLETIARHASTLVLGSVISVCVHRGHPAPDAAHRMNGVRLLAAGGGLHADHFLFPHDCGNLATALLSVVAVAAGETPQRPPASPAPALRAAGERPEVVTEARHHRSYVWRMGTGVEVSVSVHLPHDAAEPGHGRPDVFVTMGPEDDTPGLDVVMTPADARDLAGSLLEAAAKAGPAGDPRYVRLGLAGCVEPAGIHSDWRGEDAIAVAAHPAHEHRKGWHQAATISLHLLPGRGKPVRVTMSGADVRELITGVLHKSVLVAGSPPDGERGITGEDDWYSPAGEMTVSHDHSLVRSDVHLGHENAGDDHQQTWIELWLQPAGTRPAEAAGIDLPAGEVLLLTASLQRALHAIGEELPDH